VVVFVSDHQEALVLQAPFIDPAWTIVEVLRRYPSTLRVFLEYGIDVGCGSGATLAEAAARDGADLRELLDALQQTARERWPSYHATTASHHHLHRHAEACP
jgi:iron-sulfur cluster repair protein YtfE (RIC family)